jgi:ribosomal protein L7Ae-like RNA K-turn-binding protein
MKNRMLSYLGLAMRSGKLVTGEEKVLAAIRSGEAKLVVLAEDASANARKKYIDKCSYYRIPLIECGTRCELGRCIGKESRVAVAVLDRGFAQLMLKCQGNPPEVKQFE